MIRDYRCYLDLGVKLKTPQITSRGYRYLHARRIGVSSEESYQIFRGIALFIAAAPSGPGDDILFQRWCCLLSGHSSPFGTPPGVAVQREPYK
ncbi:hypothetical protein PM082_002314 [Marasmius tenuissimus]|nr:hypothetical protein PM082_002314 [Marasmius tenuissimus]